VIASGILVILALAAFLTWRYAYRTTPVAFQFARLERGRIEATVSATGACNAVVSVQVGSQVSGNIKALYADFNTRVKADQLVALIDPEIFQAKVRQAEANWKHSKAAVENAKASVEKSQADVYSARATEANQLAAIAKAKAGVLDAHTKLDRRQKLYEQQILSKEDFDTAQATYDQAIAEQQAAEAQHDAAVHNIQSAAAALEAATKTVAMFNDEVELNEAALNQARIDLRHTAPVDGTVVARRMDVGQTVAASFQAPTIFEIAQDLTKMQVDTNIAESDVGRLQLGQPASFTVDAYPGLVFTGRVKQIRQAPINVQNVITYDAVIEVANPELKLFPGMTANVTILTQRRENVLKLPNAALRFKPTPNLLEAPVVAGKPRSSGWAVAYVTSHNSKVRAVPVKIGATDSNFTEIQEGNLQEGQQVIVGAITPGTITPAPAPGFSRRI
jgi:HlyD family secretion protein